MLFIEYIKIMTRDLYILLKKKIKNLEHFYIFRKEK